MMRLVRLEELDKINGFRLLVNNNEDESYTVPMYFDLKELCD